ncbi:MAG TPA: DUF72 domain-containing protein [Allosphingosinicella sp.]|jgi:uncharacterized protein YecE (DUF72 family)|uniref:DUF72 domain-containing protein n=1 Tax=Allosphingosinicella sp. TaxID=2823234 RepID=UPI002F2A7870
MPELRIGTAGWSIPVATADAFPAEGSSLERYSAHFRCAEINSTFHRSHRPSTFERWAESTPADFRFSAKLPKTITHVQKLVDCEALLDRYLEEVAGLGERLAVHLVQLPPSLQFDEALADRFIGALKSRTELSVACEPRHASWFDLTASALLAKLDVARVAADPARVEAAAEPGGWGGLVYLRLHGSPTMYRSSYNDGRLKSYAAQIRTTLPQADVWCIFDNTASSAATGDALALSRLLAEL